MSGFATTQWSLVLAAGERQQPEADYALESLCRAYWYPLYAYARRRMASADEAQEATQAFFAELLEKNVFAQARPERGRFRAFLLAAFKHFLSKQRERARTQKRGGDRRRWSIDWDAGERRYRVEPVDDATPERLYDRQWAVTLLEWVMQRLEAEQTAAGKRDVFDRLKPLLAGDAPRGSPAELAAELQMSEGAVRTSVHRLRQRFRQLLREEIEHTVADPAEVDDELQSLFTALSG